MKQLWRTMDYNNNFVWISCVLFISVLTSASVLAVGSGSGDYDYCSNFTSCSACLNETNTNCTWLTCSTNLTGRCILANTTIPEGCQNTNCSTEEPTTTTSTLTTEPPTVPTTTTAAPTTTSSPPGTNSTVTPTIPITIPSTSRPASKARRHFDGPSFIGGMILSTGVMAISFVAYRFYRARTDRNYHTLLP